jgi:ATP-dependent helicase/nuclease subunit A
VSAGEQLRIAEAGPAPPRSARRDSGAGGGIEPPPPTPEQQRAIAARDRDVFLEAGAGTGKTGVLVSRYCDAVTEDGVGIDAILAFTFTEKAAGELRSRIRAELARRAGAAKERDPERGRELWRLARDTERAWIGTIHGFCRRLLASHPVAAGLDPRFRVLDEAEAELVAERAFEAALEELTEDGDAEAEAVAAGFRVPRLRALIVSTHDKLRSQGFERPGLPDMPEPVVAGTNRKNGPDAGELTVAEQAAAREAYRFLRALLDAFCREFERLKAERSALDFEDLQLRAVRLLRDRPAIAAAYRERFNHLMVDEFQDTNRLQIDLIRALRGPETRVFSVGDEFQSIYGFRHADLEVFRAERARAAAAPDSELELLPLRGNFRSHPVVLAAVNALGDALLDDFRPLTGGAAEDPDAGRPIAELLLTEADGWDAEGIELESVPGEQTSPARVAEARYLAARLGELADSGVPRGEMVLLLRAFTHVAAHEEALERAGLAPYVVGGRGYWSDQQVEDMLRLLACVANPLDDESLFGALASPACGASPDALWMLRQAARDAEGRPRHVWPAVERNFGPRAGEGTAEDGDAEDPAAAWVAGIGAQDAARLRGFHDTLVALRSEAPLLSLEALTERAARDFGYDLAVLMRDRGPRRLANVRKLMRLARRFEAAEGRDLPGFLRYAEARSARDEREGQAATQAEDHDGVRIMTVHAAKGLEFGTVAVADLGRPMLAGGRQPDLWLGDPATPSGGPATELDEAPPALGLRLARAGQPSITLWEFKRLQDEAAEADSTEGRRLTYVAATRARHRLLLSGVFGDKDLEGGDLKASHSAIRRLLPALGFTGDEEPLSVPGGEIAVSINRASPESARELVRRAGAVESAPPAGDAGPPPLLTPGGGAYSVGHLSYAALADYERCGYRFYAERALGLGAPASDDSAPAPEERSDEELSEADLDVERPSPGGRQRRLGLGNAVHSLLEWSARNRWARPGRERQAAALRQEGLPPDAREIERVDALVEAWLGSELLASLDGPRARLRPEASFVLAVGDSVVRGKMDLLAERDGEPVVVDYKTDALGDADPEQHAARYATQRDLYALAAAAGAGASGNGTAPRVRTVYCFLERPDRPVEYAFAPADLDAARDRIERLIAGVAAARFDVTTAPHRALCLDCPARERLCTHPPERTLAPLGP